MKEAKNLLVVIPHSGMRRPKEIKNSWISEHNRQLIYSENAETDRGTKELYDFRKILGNKQLVFPINQIYINVCRHPKRLEEAVPLFIRNVPVYKKDKELSKELRTRLLKEYYFPFYEKIRKTKKSLILNGHSMTAGHTSLGKEKLEDDIVLSDWLDLNGKVIQFAPKKLVDFYADELRKRLPHLKIGRNSVYVSSYDFICASFGGNEKSENHDRVPVIHQETEESLYVEGNKINRTKLNALKETFADSLYETMKHFSIA